MKLLILLAFITTFAEARSIVPDRVVTPPLDLFNRRNKVFPNGDVEVSVTTWSKRGKFIHHGGKKVIQKNEFQLMKSTASAVLEMIPANGPNEEERKYRHGTAFSIGENLVLTNNHVLEESFRNHKECSDFQLLDSKGNTFDCKTVHFCSAELDVCLIEMFPLIKTRRDCFLCARTKYEVSLSQGPSLKLKLTFAVDYGQSQKTILTAIGNTGGYGIHYSQGRGTTVTKEKIYFYAPITK